MIPHKAFWIHHYLYFHKIYKRIVGTQQNLSTEAWNKHSVCFLQNIKNGLSNSYFVKIKCFRLQTCKLLGKRRKTYVLDVICNKFYFGEVQKKDLGHCSGQGIYLSTQNRRSICLSVGCSRKKKQAGWLRKCLLKYSTEVRFILEILENSKVIASEFP